MLTAMAHTWLRLAEATNYVDRQAAQFRLNADEAMQRVPDASPDVQQMWLRLAESWLRLLSDDQKAYLGTAPKAKEHSATARRWH